MAKEVPEELIQRDRLRRRGATGRLGIGVLAEAVFRSSQAFLLLNRIPSCSAKFERPKCVSTFGFTNAAKGP